jgi:hypothetical protein
MYNDVSYLLWEHWNKYENYEMNIKYPKIHFKNTIILLIIINNNNNYTNLLWYSAPQHLKSQELK